MGYAHLTTYRPSLYQHFEATRRAIHTVNLDPASKKINHPVAMDISEHISLADVMEELQLASNGGLMYYYMGHFEETRLTEELEYYMANHCLVCDRNEMGVKMD
ncbi:hypothetical protein L6452_02360 [Arctium lappa]|uniref:Uncharacterized protein n=1 Tax=Arctium lappa TaxID=4217 RepID=A0ACB9FJP6_ARCLA|nr:hypothetical protein L6452_02360 [Arctium lappa]